MLAPLTELVFAVVVASLGYLVRRLAWTTGASLGLEHGIV